MILNKNQIYLQRQEFNKNYCKFYINFNENSFIFHPNKKQRKVILWKYKKNIFFILESK